MGYKPTLTYITYQIAQGFSFQLWDINIYKLEAQMGAVEVLAFNYGI